MISAIGFRLWLANRLLQTSFGRQQGSSCVRTIASAVVAFLGGPRLWRIMNWRSPLGGSYRIDWKVGFLPQIHAFQHLIGHFIHNLSFVNLDFAYSVTEL